MISSIFSAIFLSFFASAVILNYKVGRLLNLSFASIFTAGAYIFLSVNSTTAILLAFFAGFAVGAAISKITESLSAGEATIVSLGFGIAIEEAIRLTCRSSYYQIVEASYINLLGEAVSVHEVWNSILLISLLLVFATILISRRGLELKFVEDDWELAEMYGVDTSRIRFLVIVISSGLICVSGAILSPTQPLHPSMGWSIMIVAVIIAALATSTGDAGLRKYALTLPTALAYAFILQILRWSL